MSFKNFQALTNQRPVKKLGKQVIASCTSGQIKITPELAEELGVSVGDTVTLIKDSKNLLEGGEGAIYVAKGNDEIGGKLASANKSGGGILTFSGAVAWNTLDGDADYNTHFDAGEAVEYDDTEFFPLTFAEKVEKTARKSKGSKTESQDTSNQAETPQPVADELSDFDDM